jgi:asparagine synthase (glutamine-hydrolysing)
MSAIAGVMLFDDGKGMDVNRIGSALMEALPADHADQSATWSNDRIFLGCHQQWLTPESRSEHVPLEHPECGAVITADAIIDNRQELFDELGIPAHRRPQIGDAELILLAYEKWGEDCPKHLLGDYAFLIWDEREGHLFGARDWCGNRMLYYVSNGAGCFFSTTITPLFQVPGMRKELNMIWLAEFLAIRGLYECSDPALTPYNDVYLVPPAHTIKIKQDGSVSISQYGSLIPETTLRLKSDKEYEEMFRDVFERAVKDRLRTYREVAATLSGGLDSGTVVGFAARGLREKGKKLFTYSYVPMEGFTDWTPDHLAGNERPYIEQVVRYVGNIVPNYMDFPDYTPLSNVDDLLDILEAPYKFFGGLFWINGIYEAAAGDGANILLTGGRGNFTISWGPALDYYAELLRRFRWIKLYQELREYSQRMRISRRKLFSVIRHKAFSSSAPDNGSIIPSMIHPELAKRTGVLERQPEIEPLTMNSFEDRWMKFSNLSIMNKSGSVATKLSLRHGIWERDPTFDLRVVRFCLSLPTEQCVRQGMDRALVRRVTKGILPDEVRLNQTVRGVQAADWISRLLPVWSSVLLECNRMCEDSLVSGILHTDSIRDAVLEVGLSPKPEHAFHPKMQFLMRCLIVYRFLQRL